MLLKLRQIVTDDPVFGVLLFYDIAFVLFLLNLLTDGISRDEYFVMATIATFVGLTITHRLLKNPYSKNIFVILFAVLVGYALPDPSVAGYVHFVVAFPVLTSLIITEYKWILAAGVTSYLLLLYRGHFGGVYADPINIILYVIIVFGAIGARYILSRTSQKLESSERERENLATLVDGIGDGVAVIDPFWKIEIWNTRAQEITGYSAPEAIGKRITDVLKLIDENTREPSYSFISDAIAKHGRSSMGATVLLVTKSGKEVHVGDSAAPLFKPNGDIERLIVVFRDAANEREQSRFNTDFVYAQHQLRTPLTEARWAVETAQNTANTEETKEALHTAERSLESAIKLANNLITVSELENKMRIPELAMVSLVDIIEEAHKGVQALADKAGVKVEFAPISRSEGIFTDRKMLVEILVELLENGIAYSVDKSPVRVEAKADNGGYTFEISGKSKPISPQEQPLLFTKFFRGSNKPEESVGSGLGLYISKRLAELLGGRAWFKSAEEETSFYVAIPEKKK